MVEAFWPLAPGTVRDPVLIERSGQWQSRPSPAMFSSGIYRYAHLHTHNTTPTHAHPYIGNFNFKWGNLCEISPQWTFSWTFAKTYLYRQMYRKYLCKHQHLLFYSLPSEIWYTLHNLSIYVELNLITTCVPGHSHVSGVTGFSRMKSLLLNVVFPSTYINLTEYVNSSVTYQT